MYYENGEENKFSIVQNFDILNELYSKFNSFGREVCVKAAAEFYEQKESSVDEYYNSIEAKIESNKMHKD